MTPLPNLRRFALLLALLPQLLVLGFGRGVVVCIAPGGHVQLEIAASTCCGDDGASTAPGDRDLASSQDEPDCGSCSDLQIALDPRVARGSGTQQIELPAHAAAIPPGPVGIPGAADATGLLDRILDRGHEPPHLIHLRSVQLRC